MEQSNHHGESFCSQANFPAAVAQKLSSNGSILAQPSPYKNLSSCPTSVILSPAMNKKFYQRSEATVNTVPSMSPLVMATSSSSHCTVDGGTVGQSSVTTNNVSTSTAPPPMDVTLQPRLPFTQSSSSEGVSNSTLTSSETAHPSGRQPARNRPGHDVMAKDPSSALIEQHNVRVVPAVLSFGSLSSHSLSASSMSQHNMPSSLVHVNTSTNIVSSQTSLSGTPSLFKPSDAYNSPSIGHLGNTVSWLHPNGPQFTINTTSHQTTGSVVHSDVKVHSTMFTSILGYCLSCTCGCLVC